MVITFALTGCDDDNSNDPPEPATSWPADQVAVVVAGDAPAAVLWTADDLRDSLEEATGMSPTRVTSVDDTDLPYLILLGDGDWDCPELIDDQAYAIVEQTYDDREALALCGGGLLGQQYAAYAYLFALGFRFVHPEQTLVPTIDELPPRCPPGLDDTPQTPELEVRGFHSHTQHPLELLEALLTDNPDEAERAQRYVDWLLRNRQNLIQWILLDSIPQQEVLTQAERVISYAHERGLLASAVTSFNEEQQNAHTLINPDDGVDDVEELQAGLEALAGAGFDKIVINIGASEFSETDDVMTVEWMDAAALHLDSIAPGVDVYASNHVPAGLVSETYGVNFYDLPQFAVAEMGTYVHTTMCYGLEGPAPVYGNTDFARQRNFLVDQVDDRNIIYYPESAWWLTFDNAIPLSPAMYFRVRSADLRFIAGVEGVEGHVTFTSGWEWGYWLTDLLIAYQSWQPEMSLEEVLDDLLTPLASEAGDIASRMAESEWTHLIEGRLLPFLTAEDLPTEIGYRAGIVFHELAPAPAEVMAYSEDQLDDLDEQLDDLEGFCEEMEGFTAEWQALPDAMGQTDFDVVTPQAQEEAARRPAVITAAPLLEELRDGTAITAARCRNALANYGALSAARRIALELTTDADPATLLEEAAAQTAEAAVIVEAREQAYRYEPARVSAHEDTDTEGVENATDYPYRVNGRTHVLFFWHRRDQLVAEAVSGSSQQLLVAPQQLLAGESVSVDGTNAGFDEGEDVNVLWGDGDEDSSPTGASALFDHTYETPSQPTLAVSATAEGELVSIELPLSVATHIYSMPSAQFHLVEPDDAFAEIALRPFLPNLQLGLNGGTPAESAPLASLAFDRDLDGLADWGTVIHLPEGMRAGDHLIFENFDVTVPVESSSGRFGTIFLRDALLEFDLTETDAPLDTLTNGRLHTSVRTEELIGLVVATGVFEREGTISLLADIFGFDPADVPEHVEVELSLEGPLIASVE